jgi:hypothetical protein
MRRCFALAYALVGCHLRAIPAALTFVLMLCFSLPDHAADPPTTAILGIATDAGPKADFLAMGNTFCVSADAAAVRFAFGAQGKTPALFDLATGLKLHPPNTLLRSCMPARTAAPGLKLEDWYYTREPKINGRLLKRVTDDESVGAAITADNQSFVLGTVAFLSLYSRDGQQRWRVSVPEGIQAVNVSGGGRTIVAALADGTIRWYDLKDGHENLALFAQRDRQRWVAWTPSGFYNASAGGEDLVGWHVNHGPDAMADFYPASRFRTQFNRPDVIARALTTASEAEAVRLADIENRRTTTTATASIQTLLPPVVDVLTPEIAVALGDRSVRVRYSTRSPPNAPVTDIKVRIDGRPVALVDAPRLPLDGKNAQEVTVPIQVGDQKIQLFATNRNAASTPAVVRLSWQFPNPVEMIGTAPATGRVTPRGLSRTIIYKPKLYVLAVGVSKYANHDFDLGLPSKDARDFAQVWREQQGQLYSDVEVRLLIDDEATKDNILDGLDWLQHQVTARDVAIMFLAGHGTNDNVGKYFFMPYNGDPDRLLRTAVPQADLRDALSSLAGKVMFFIDTCHSGNALGTAISRDPRNDIAGFVNDLTSAENGVIVFTASTGRQFSLEDPAWGNGAFTKAVVEGLTGKADFEHTGSITHRGLDYYVAERVKELTRGKQSPVSIVPNGIEDFPIAIAGGSVQ